MSQRHQDQKAQSEAQRSSSLVAQLQAMVAEREAKVQQLELEIRQLGMQVRGAGTCQTSWQHLFPQSSWGGACARLPVPTSCALLDSKDIGVP